MHFYIYITYYDNVKLETYVPAKKKKKKIKINAIFVVILKTLKVNSPTKKKMNQSHEM